MGFRVEGLGLRVLGLGSSFIPLRVVTWSLHIWALKWGTLVSVIGSRAFREL